ncbi:HlyD family secretion protein [Thalassovita litoralis]|jgi:HlyD family secretion protein|uniref:Membrane fusion protein (MFP) family protein n=1 Tax=Thalassovita litoralis TaxID=1010611 RepID=A0A521E7Z2_9RHOB|nr:HlyD family type I secretion periplasmic adaptor subunit [Thalassovita litoralis]SMO80066.1 HlyD family secretion protein [Thalassovita litoralis]
MKGKSIRPVVIAGSIVVFLTFGVLGGWASVAKLDSAVVAPGTITLDSNRKVIQHLEGGIVEEILVREADQVKQGDVLLRLNNIEARSNLDVIQLRLSVARITEARLLAERNVEEDVQFPEEFSGDLSTAVKAALMDQQELFEDRRNILQSQVEIFESRIAQTKEQIDGLGMQKSALERRLENYQSLVERMTSGEEKGLVQSNLLSQRRDELIDIEANLGRIVSEIAQAKNAVSVTELELLQAKQQYRERANTDLEKVRAEISELKERGKVVEDVLLRTEIVAPEAGNIQNLKVHTLGSVIRPGDILMELVPDDDEMIITAQVSPTDIDNVHPGLITEVRFSAFKTRLTPIVLGKVETVSRDVITPSSGDAPPYYLARIKVPDEDIPEDIRDRITAGMPVDTVIATGERRVVTYLAAPVMDAIRKSLIEE